MTTILVVFLATSFMWLGVFGVMYMAEDHRVTGWVAQVIDKLTLLRQHRDGRAKASDVYRDALVHLMEAAKGDNAKALDEALFLADEALAEADEIAGGGR